MIELIKCYKLLDDDFSLITVSEDKIPNIKWKQYQEQQISKEEFAKIYKLPTTDNIGIVTGYQDLECVDIDLKVFSTAKEKVDFWEEYISFLKDNIFDFYTISFGLRNTKDLDKGEWKIGDAIMGYELLAKGNSYMVVDALTEERADNF